MNPQTTNQLRLLSIIGLGILLLTTQVASINHHARHLNHHHNQQHEVRHQAQQQERQYVPENQNSHVHGRYLAQQQQILKPSRSATIVTIFTVTETKTENDPAKTIRSKAEPASTDTPHINTSKLLVIPLEVLDVGDDVLGILAIFSEAAKASQMEDIEVFLNDAVDINEASEIVEKEANNDQEIKIGSETWKVEKEGNGKMTMTYWVMVWVVPAVLIGIQVQDGV